MQEGSDITFDSRSVWEKLKEELEDQLDEDNTQEALTLMKDKLFLPRNVSMDICHPRQLLEHLENNYSEKECIEILRHVFHVMGNHVDSGTRNFTEVIDEYEKQLPGNRKDLIGRDEDIQDVMKSLVENKYKGFWLCGLGGMGKTTLAEEICYRLQHNLRYRFMKVDMKGKNSLVDLSQEILIAQNLLWRESGERSNNMESSARSSQLSILRMQVLQSLNNFTDESVLLLDNMDDLQGEEGENLASYLRDFLSGISELNEKCKLRVIITARHKFLKALSETGQNVSSGYDEVHWREIELKGLSEKDAQKLAKKSASPIRLSTEESKEVAEVCGGCPLAICILSRYIRGQWSYPVAEILSLIKWRLSDIVPCCIEKSFDDLPQETKEQFIQLSVFNICPFNVQSAAAIWFDDASEQSIAKAEIGLLQLKYRHLVECRRPCDPNTQGLLTNGEKDTVTYSLHPLIFSSLRILLGNNRYLEDSSNLAKARFLELYINKLLLVEESLERERKQALQIVASDKVHFQNIFLWNSTLTLSTASSLKFLYSLGIKTSKLLTTFAKIINKAEEALKVFKELAETSNKLGNRDAFFFWSVQQAEACLDCDMIKDAKQILRSGDLQYYCKEEGTVDVYRLFTAAEFHYVQGMLFNKKKHYGKALRKFDKSLEFYKTCKPEDSFTVYHAAAINAKGNVHFKLEDYSNALKCHQKAHDLIVRRVGSDFHEHKSIYLHNIGSIHHVSALKNWKRNKEEANVLLGKALETYDECIYQDVLYKQTADPYHADRLRIRSDIYLRLKHFDKAFADAERALKIQKDLHVEKHSSITISRYQLARCYMKRAKECMNKGDKEKADRDLRKCWLTFVQVQDDIKKGGLSSLDQQCSNIRNDHLKLIERNGSRQEYWKIERFYARFKEKGRLGESRSPSSGSKTSSSMSSSTDEDQDDRVHLSHPDSGISECSYTRSSLEVMPSTSSFHSLSLEHAPSIEDEVLMNDDSMEGIRPQAAERKGMAMKRKLSDSDD